MRYLMFVPLENKPMPIIWIGKTIPPTRRQSRVKTVGENYFKGKNGSRYAKIEGKAWDIWSHNGFCILFMQRPQKITKRQEH